MKGASFTPGPWLYGSTIRAAGMGERAGKIAEVSIAFKDSATRDANGHLIAAAPELYDLAEQFERVAEYELRKMEREKPEDDEGIRLRSLNLNLIRETLAKARGRA